MKNKIIPLLNKKLFERLESHKLQISEARKQKKLKEPFSIGDGILISGNGRDNNGNTLLFFKLSIDGRHKSIQTGEFNYIDFSDLSKEKFIKRKDFKEIKNKINLYKGK